MHTYIPAPHIHDLQPAEYDTHTSSRYHIDLYLHTLLHITNTHTYSLPYINTQTQYLRCLCFFSSLSFVVMNNDRLNGVGC